jgi:hypothetical protein
MKKLIGIFAIILIATSVFGQFNLGRGACDFSNQSVLEGLTRIENGKIIRHGPPSEIFINKGISGKFQFAGEVLNISKEDVIYIITVLIDQQLVKVVAEESTANQIAVGDKVLVTSKAFNPIIQKLV